MTVESLPRGWISVPFLRLLFQNLLVEERADIRDATLTTWREVLSIMGSTSGWLGNAISQPMLLDWYSLLMTPLGLPLETANFYDPTVTSDNSAPTERHNVDKNMLAQDLSLVPVEVVIQARLATSEALAHIIAFWPTSVRLHFTSRCKLYIDCFTEQREFHLRRRHLPTHPGTLHRVPKYAAKVPRRHHL